ncbi:MAG: Fur family transcriptional regulator [Desulfobacterales bacterium RIFOXYA12_FULL_46_15]|nr:MAG: Fur family transcriptional regulator [Desulfobacula sp. GWF2_41_7]OGR27127.1 MAG: Fur family transcriptional regulator [Desulfobacterales bacterium RIFOXYA12_FULL_46_15]
MIDTHEHEKKQFKRLFQQQGIDRFDSRLLVLEAFLKLEHHVTINDLVAQLEEDKAHLEKGFVLSSMELLYKFGFATKIEFEDKETQYEHRHLGLHHDHMVCTKCGMILEFKDEALEKQQLIVAEAYGFHMLQHKMEIYGICSNCLKDRSPLVPLHKAKKGEKLIVKELEAGKNMQLRISSMGLKIGDLIEIVSTGFGGQVVIANGDNRMVLGKGMAEKVMVQLFNQSVEQDRDIEGNKDFGEPPQETLLLSRMKSGQEGIVRKVAGEGVLRRRLLEMGINRGTAIYVEKYAPLKDPIEIVVKGYHMSLRVEEAANILVEKIGFKNRKNE